MTPIADLLKLAAEASPPAAPPRSKWVKYAPVVRELEKKGHSIKSAVDWIIAQGGIPESSQSTAYRSLRQFFHRQNTK
jgi:hypothetical protein